MAEIFISYAREERHKVEPFVTLLTEQGWDVWWDREITPGVNFERTIDREISSAKCVVVFWSQQSVASDWVLAEANEGLERGVLIPVMLEQVRVPLIFRSKQSVMLDGWPDRVEAQELERGLTAIGELLDRPLSTEVRLPTPKRQRWIGLSLAIGIGILLAAVAVAVLFQRDFLEMAQGRLAEDQNLVTTIAVLPFRSDEGDDRYNGLSFEIADTLQQSRNIHVVSNSHLQIHLSYPDKIELGAQYVVNGILRDQGDHENLTISLFDRDATTTVWTETFELQPGQMTTSTRRISNRIAKTFNGEQVLTGSVPISAGDYSDYLHAQTLLRDPQGPLELTMSRDLLRQVADRAPRFAEAYVGLCNANLALYREVNRSEYFEAAERYCYRANTLNSRNSSVHNAIGELYIAAGEYEQALQSLNKALELSPNSTQVLRSTASAYIFQRRGKEALSLLQRAIELEPSYWGTYSQLAGFYFNLGNYEKAAENYLIAEKLVFNNPRILTNLGAAYFLLENFDGAVDSWLAANKLAPAAPTYSNLGSAHFFRGEYQKAFDAYRSSIELNPEDDQLWAHAGEARVQLGEESESYFARALELAQARLSINPNRGETLGKLASYYAALARDQEAIEHITLALEAQPDDVYTVYDAAVTYSRLDKVEEEAIYIARLKELGYSVSLIERDANFRHAPD